MGLSVGGFVSCQLFLAMRLVHENVLVVLLTKKGKMHRFVSP